MGNWLETLRIEQGNHDTVVVLDGPEKRRKLQYFDFDVRDY